MGGSPVRTRAAAARGPVVGRHELDRVPVEGRVRLHKETDSVPRRERGSSLGSGKRKVDGDPQWPAGGLPSADRASAEKDRHQRRPEAHGGENDRRCLPHLMGKVDRRCVAAGPDGGC